MHDLVQSVDAWIPIRLTKSAVAVTGLLAAGLTCKFLKASAGAFAPKVLVDVTNFVEVGEGFYRVKFLAADLDTLGAFVVLVSGAAIDDSEVEADVVLATVATDAVDIATCNVIGHFVDEQGQHLEGAAVYWRAVGVTSKLGALVRRRSGVTKTRDDGTFTLAIPRMIEVVVDSPEAEYSRRLTVPNQASADLLAIP